MNELSRTRQNWALLFVLKFVRKRMLSTQFPDFEVSEQTSPISPLANQIAFLFERFFRDLTNGAQRMSMPDQACHKLLTTLCDHRFRGLPIG